MLTRRQRDVLVFIRDYQNREGAVSPACTDIAEGLGIVSKGNVSAHLTALEQRGYIRRLFGRARAIEILKPPTSAVRIPIYDAATHQIRGYVS